ncbi:MAG: glutathione S-transferase [Pseudomonadota bacterium]
MTYDLFIGDRTFSSWSLRGWLMFAKFGIHVNTHLVGLYSGTMAQDLAELAPARLVPVMRDADGIAIGDTLAMAETLAERHPDAGLWPKDPAVRAFARWIVAEMHSGFTALREACPMQLQHQIQGFEQSDAVMADLLRIEHLWTLAKTKHGAKGPWLLGEYSLADVFYAPVTARIAGYKLPVGSLAQDYTMQTIADPEFVTWRTEGLKVTYDPFPYHSGLPTAPWPGPN